MSHIFLHIYIDIKVTKLLASSYHKFDFDYFSVTYDVVRLYNLRRNIIDSFHETMPE